MSRQVKDENGKVKDAHARDDQIHDVEKRFAPNNHVKVNVWNEKRKGNTAVNHHYSFSNTLLREKNLLCRSICYNLMHNKYID